VVGIGRYWVKIQTSGAAPPFGHESNYYYLQNIQTGEFEADPIMPGGTVFDDLSTPSGSSQLCGPLRYPGLYNAAVPRWEPGYLTFYGQFALTLEGGSQFNPPYQRLRRCGSRLNLLVYNPYQYSGSASPSGIGPVASSRAVIVTLDGKTLQGWLLPSLRRFTITPPPATQTHCSPVARRAGEHNGLIPIALTARTVYVRGLCGTQRLWAATLPAPNR
jgi:hypothetical protein